MKIEQTECSETSAYKIQTPGNYLIYPLVYEDGTECSETSAYKIQTPGNYLIYLLVYEDGTDSVPKRRHVKFRRRGITQKETQYDFD
jgi:hypothetical protein